MKTLKLFLALALVAFLSSSFTFKTQSTIASSNVIVTDYYLGTFDFITDEEQLVLPIKIYGYEDGYGVTIVTRGAGIVSGFPYTISGTVSWSGGLGWANLNMTAPLTLSQAGYLY